MSVSLRRSLMALCILLSRLLLGGRGLLSASLTHILSCFTSSVLSFFTKALDGAQSSSEERRQEQWDCSLWDHDHRVDWEAARVLEQPQYWKRRTLEAIHIMRHGNTTNLDCRLTLNSIWTPFLTL